MAITNNERTINIANVVRHDGPLQVPTTMDLRAAAEVLLRAADAEEQRIDLHATVPAAPFDGAYAMVQAMEEEFGAAVQLSVWGERHNIKVPIDAHGTTVDIPWGAFQVPVLAGATLETSRTRDDNGRWVFQMNGSMRGMDRHHFDKLYRRTMEIVRERSIYRGKALDLRLSDGGLHEGVAKIRFLDVRAARRPIYTDVLDDAIENDVLTYITHPELVRKLRGTTKLGVLLAGKFGVGKTMLAMYIAKLCEEMGRTFLYVKPDDVPAAIEFGAMYAPATIFTEDVESIAGANRTEFVNLLLNKLDGVDTKGNDLMFVATTNSPEDINPAMMRVGRIDVRLHITPPDAKAAIEIAHSYAKGDVRYEDDFSEAGEYLAGQIPAVIEQAVARAQIRDARNAGSATLTARSLLAAAKAVQNEQSLFQHVPPKEPMEKLGDSLGVGIGRGVGEALAQLALPTPNGHAPSTVRS